MDKIKHVISNRKSAEATRDGEAMSSAADPHHGATTGGLSGEGSHLARAQQGPLTDTTNSEGYHPIYDEFKGRREENAENPPHFSNTTHLTGSHAVSGHQDNLTVASAHNASSQRQNVLTEDASTASIRSGVIGFPEGEYDTHASLGRNPIKRELDDHQTYATGTNQLLGHTVRGDQKESSHIEREGAPNASALQTGEAVPHGLHHQKGDVSSASHTLDDPDASSLEAAGGTDRYFPLAGGVIGERQTRYSSTNPITHDSEPVAKERDSAVEEGHGHGHGREALAGAAAAATVSSAVPLSHNTHERESTREHEAAGPEAHAGTVAAKGPHVTDTANRLDPRLHIPGEYPDPTPVEETPEPSFSHQEGIGAAPVPAGDSSKATAEHHHGRDTAIAGGATAAGALAGAHHQREMANIEGQQYPIESSPYSSKSIDPRVYGKAQPPISTETQPGPLQVQDAARSTTERDAAVAAGFEASKPPGIAQGNTQPPTANQEEISKHHYGRDAGLVGVGAAAAGGIYASQRDGKPESGPASETIGPHKSNIANVVDPRVQPDPSLQRHQVGSTSTPEDPASMTIGPHKSNIANILDPRVQPDPNKQKSHSTIDQGGDKHHYGRDAATVGGVGAAGYGAYEAGKAYDAHRSTQPAASMNDQRYDPTAPGAHDPTAVSKLESGHVHYPSRGGLEEPYHGGAVGTAGAGAGAYAESRNAPESSFAKQLKHDESVQGTQETQQHSQHHYARDAAVVGGLGAAGAGAYAATHGNDDTRQPQVSHQTQHRRYDSTQVPDQYDQKHDAPTAGAAEAAVGGAAGYGLSQHDADKAEKERLKAREKELEQQRKDEQKALDKRLAKEEKHRDKLAAAEFKHHQKEMKKEEKQHQKELEREQKIEEKGEKKHHFFGFLHRDKKDKDRSGSESESPRASHEYLADTGVGPAGAYESTSHAIPHDLHDEDSDGRRERHRLHKDPPVGHPSREMMESEKHQHVGTDGLIGRPGQISGDRTTREGIYDAHEPEEMQHRAAEPHTGF